MQPGRKTPVERPHFRAAKWVSQKRTRERNREQVPPQEEQTKERGRENGCSLKAPLENGRAAYAPHRNATGPTTGRAGQPPAHPGSTMFSLTVPRGSTYKRRSVSSCTARRSPELTPSSRATGAMEVHSHRQCHREPADRWRASMQRKTRTVSTSHTCGLPAWGHHAKSSLCGFSYNLRTASFEHSLTQNRKRVLAGPGGIVCYRTRKARSARRVPQGGGDSRDASGGTSPVGRSGGTGSALWGAPLRFRLPVGSLRPLRRALPCPQTKAEGPSGRV